MTAREFAREIVEGTGGFDAWVEREGPVDPATADGRIELAYWTMRCLANPRCEGSEEAVAAILEHRRQCIGEKAKKGG
jgi:hypothetical protein